ncbi:MAG TPA: helix-turn-helix domain-containing protein [Ruminiclostridium sp.]
MNNKLLANKKQQDMPKKLYPKILLSFTVSITLTIIILSAVLYFSFESIVLQINTSFVKDNLTQVSYSGTQMNKTAYSLLMQMNADSDIRDMLFNYMPEIEQLTLSQNSLSSFVSVNPFVQSIYVYNGFNDKIYDSGTTSWSRDGFYDKEILYILDNFQKYQVLTPITRVIRNNTLNSSSGIQSNVYTYVFFDTQLNKDSNKLDNAIVVNISESFIKDMINAMSSNKSNEIFIIDSTGTLLQTNTSSKILSKITDRSYIQKIILSPDSQGSFVDSVDDRKSLVTFASSSVMDWKIICVTPYEIIMDKINYMKYKVIIICCILFTIGILASYLLAKRINSPINFMQNKLSSLQIEQRHNLVLQKQMFLKTILQSGISSNLENTLETLKEFGVKIDPLEKYIVIMLKIDHYFDFCNKYNSSDRSLFRFSIMNISSEICEAHFKNETLDLDDDHMVMIVNASDSIEQIQLIKEVSTSIIESILTYLNFSISISISSISQDISDLNTKYDEALEASQYRVYSGSNSILMYQDIMVKHSKLFSYPIQKENKFIEALMLGNMEVVQTIFNDILATTTSYSYNSFSLTLLRLTTAIHIALDNFEKNSNYQIGYDFSRFIMDLNKIEYLDDIQKHFFGLFEYIFEKLLERKDTKYDELITKVIELINHNYSDNNLSIDSIAETIGISSSYIGKLFKKFTSNTISDHITQTRLEASKKLLASTDFSVDKITETIGLSYSNYFYKIFKKTYGITPNEYKQKLLQQKNSST